MPGIRMRVAWALGVAAGALITPLIFPFMLMRRKRFFHPSGVIHTAQVVPPPGVLPGAPANLAARLAGPALVRFSGGLFFSSHHWDSVGVSLRFYSQPRPTAVYSRGDQDLALISLRSFSLPQILAGIRQTAVEDYLANTYWGIWPYEIEGFGRASLRITAVGAGAEGRDRAERLANAAKEGTARLLLEVTPGGSELYLPVAEIRIGPPLSAAMEQAFKLNPSSAGRGLLPSGFRHGLRVVPYKANQFARRRRRPQVSPSLEREPLSVRSPAMLALPHTPWPPSFKKGSQGIPRSGGRG